MPIKKTIISPFTAPTTIFPEQKRALTLPAMQQNNIKSNAQNLLNILKSESFVTQYQHCMSKGRELHHELAGINDDGQLVAQAVPCFGKTLECNVEETKKNIDGFIPAMRQLEQLLTQISVVDSSQTLEETLSAPSTANKHQTPTEQQALKLVCNPSIEVQERKPSWTWIKKTCNTQYFYSGFTPELTESKALNQTFHHLTSALHEPITTEYRFPSSTIEAIAVESINQANHGKDIKYLKSCLHITWEALLRLRYFATFVEPAPSLLSEKYRLYQEKLHTLPSPPLKIEEPQKKEESQPSLTKQQCYQQKSATWVLKQEPMSKSQELLVSKLAVFSKELSNLSQKLEVLTLKQKDFPEKQIMSIEPNKMKPIPIKDFKIQRFNSNNTLCNAYNLWLLLTKPTTFHEPQLEQVMFKLAGIDADGQLVALPRSISLLPTFAVAQEEFREFYPNMRRLNDLLVHWCIVDKNNSLKSTLEQIIKLNTYTHSPEVITSPLSKSIYKKVKNHPSASTCIAKHAMNLIQQTDGICMDSLQKIDRCMVVPWEVIWLLNQFTSFIIPPQSSNEFYTNYKAQVCSLPHTLTRNPNEELNDEAFFKLFDNQNNLTSEEKQTEEKQSSENNITSRKRQHAIKTVKKSRQHHLNRK